MLRIIALVFLAYLGVVFPFAYFRHDDWLILGNSVLEMPRDWLFSLRPSLIFDGEEVTWFFRPMFKLSVYVFYQLFGYAYYFWLVGLLASFAGLLWFGYQIVRRLTGNSDLASVFVGLLAASVHLHFGSLVWMGEGIMNGPQVFFLFWSTHLFLRWVDDRRYFSLVFSMLAYFAALGFKESSVIHLGFLGLVLLFEKTFSHLSLKQRFLKILPFAIVTFTYLVVRLGIMPSNPHYAFRFEAGHVFKTIGLFVVAIGFPLFAWLWAVRRHWKSLAGKPLRIFGYLAFLGVSIAPYLGLPHIFSPGWMLLPAAYAILIVCLVAETLPKGLPVFRPCLFVLCVSIVGVSVGLSQAGWWKWHRGQKQMKRIVESTPAEKYEELIIFNCPDKKYKRVHVQRVVGFKASLYHMWNMHHEKPVTVKILPCHHQERITEKMYLDKLFLRWDFPEFQPLLAKSQSK